MKIAGFFTSLMSTISQPSHTQPLKKAEHL